MVFFMTERSGCIGTIWTVFAPGMELAAEHLNLEIRYVWILPQSGG